MAIGGFNGSDPSPTLAQFQQWVRKGRSTTSSARAAAARSVAAVSVAAARAPAAARRPTSATWVEENFTAQTVDGVTLYDLTAS